MKNKIILNIPHSSLALPREFKKTEKVLTDAQIEEFNLEMTDLFADILFSYRRFSSVKAKSSRIACDVEKFIDDSKEVMAKYGLGVIYENDLNGNRIFKEDNNEYKKQIIKNYYLPYHDKLDKIVRKNLKKHKVVLVDCHSFSKEIIMDKIKKEDLPDICIGFDENFCSQKVLNFTCNYFDNLGYKIKINYPYEGSMVPDYLINYGNSNFSTIMLEINRNLYSSNYKKNKNFKTLKSQIKVFLKSLRHLII